MASPILKNRSIRPFWVEIADFRENFFERFEYPFDGLLWHEIAVCLIIPALFSVIVVTAGGTCWKQEQVPQVGSLREPTEELVLQTDEKNSLKSLLRTFSEQLRNQFSHLLIEVGFTLGQRTI